MVETPANWAYYRGMDTRTRLLDAAEQAARHAGYEGFSYAHLAETVGIKKASIHHHFRTKADLALALIERYSVRISETLKVLEDNHPVAAGALAGYLELYRGALGGGDTLCLCVALSVSPGSLTEPVLAAVSGFHADSLVWLTARFGSAIVDGSVSDVTNPAAEAAALLALVEGAQLLARAEHSEAPFLRAVALFESRLTV